MARCKYCGRSGIFFGVNRDGLCKDCVSFVVLDIKNHGRVISDCMKLVRESKNLKIQLSRCDLLIERASRLVEYENKGIPTIDPTPAQLLSEYKNKRDLLIVDGLTQDFKNALSKAEVASSTKSKVNILSKVLVKLREFKPKSINPTLLDSLEKEIALEIHRIQLDSYLDEAKKAEFKGQKKKALDKYFEALYFLKNDDIHDSLQQANISPIESKIKELGGEIPK